MIQYLIMRPVTTVMIFLGICLLGIISLNKLSVQLLPDIEFPKLTIITPYENASPAEIEKLVTKNIEEAAGSVSGVLSIYSESLEGLSLVTVRFAWGTNMDMAVVETKEKVDMIKGQLPQDTEKSIVVKYDPKEQPVMIVSVLNRQGSFVKLRNRIEKEVIPYLERVNGVALVDISGGYKRQINVDLDSAAIYSHNLSLSEIMENINASNYNFPAGSVVKDNMEYLVRTIGEFKNINEIGSVVVGQNKQGVPIYLSRLAKITQSYKDRKSIIRFNNKEAIALLIRKEPGKNTVETCRLLDQQIKELQKKFSNDISIKKIYDQSRFIKNSVNNVFTAAVLGGIIAVLTLWFFLKEFRSPLIIATTIPVSIIGTFVLMYAKGVTLNTMSLGGLALGVGMMVDAGIVVLESIAKKRSLYAHQDTTKGVIEGTSEVVGPVIGSTLTTIVVFLPIVFLSGLSGALFGELALTISFALIFSLLTSVTLIPMLSSLPFFNTSHNHNKKHKAFILSDTFMNASQALYKKLITYAVHNTKKILLIGGATLLAGIVLFMLLRTELMPSVDPGIFTIEIKTPRGTTLTETTALSYRVETQLQKKPYVKNIYAKIGSDPDETIAEKTSGKGSNNITIQVMLTNHRNKNIQEVVDELKKELFFNESIQVDYAIQKSVIESIISRRQKPLHIEIYGRDKEQLIKTGNVFKKILMENKLANNVTSVFDIKDPEMQIDVDRDRIAILGVNIADIAATIKAAIHGEAVTKFRDKDDEIDVRVRLQKSDRTEKASILKILVKTKNGATVPISKFASIIDGFGSSKLIRSEQSGVNIITGTIPGNVNSTISRIEKLLNKQTMPDGYSYELIGEKKEINRTFGEMRFALILAIILIYMLLASQFQSFKNPLIIMFSIPVTLAGAAGALLIFGKSLNINSGIGIIMLAGVVVNNAIVLFDYIEKGRKQGRPVTDAIIEAGSRRLKPILMTTFTTIFAMLPIALGVGEGAELQQPMAIAVIGGLTVSTFLTLILIPTVYVVLNRDG